MRAAPGSEAESALRHCRAITRRRARNFYYGLTLAPEPQRSALFAVYAWMRRADDLVDGADGEPEAQRQGLEAFRAATDAALEGRADGDDPLWIALADVAARFDLDRAHFHAMVDGQLEDARGGRYETFEQLREYCYRVASAVGLICIEVWGYSDPAARDLAVDRGIAFQLTNILRDFKQDFDAGRVYLPRQAFEACRLEPHELRRWTQPERCRRLIEDHLELAESFYQRSAPLDAMITAPCRPTLWAMTTIYRGLLEKIRQSPPRIVLGKRLRLSALHKSAIAFRARRMARAARNGAL